MTLAVQLAVGGVTYKLKDIKITESIEFTPIVLPLPASGTATEPLFMNLGFFKNKFTFEGIIDDSYSTDGATTIPSKNELENMVLNNAGSTITLTLFYTNVTSAPATTTSHVYTILFTACSFERNAGADSYWMLRMEAYGGARTSS